MVLCIHENSICLKPNRQQSSWGVKHRWRVPFALSLPVRALAVCVPDSEAEAEGVRKRNKEDREDRTEHQIVIELKRFSEPKELLKIIYGILPVGILVSQ